MQKLRRATQEDLPDITALVHAAYEPYIEHIGRSPAPMTVDYSAALNQHEVWVVDLDDRILGVLVLIQKPDHLLLDNIAVHKEVRGSGIGTQLLEYVDDRARDLGLGEIRLYTNEKMYENLLYYPRHGYVQTGTGVEDGFHRVYFSRYLQ